MFAFCVGEIEQVKKERFAEVRNSRKTATDADRLATSRHVPNPIKRAVYERDGGRCAFTDERGKRCTEMAAIEFDHVDGFARTGRHDIDGVRLLCRAHNQYAAERMYGREFMDRARTSRGPQPTLPGISSG